MTRFEELVCSRDMTKAVLSICAAPSVFTNARLSVIWTRQQVRRFTVEMIAQTAAMHHRVRDTGMS
jgi:hypothetical protein